MRARTHVDGTTEAEALRTKTAYVHNSRTFAMKGKVVPVHDIRPIGTGEGTSPLILHFGLDGGKWSASHSGLFTPAKKNLSTEWTLC